MLKFSDANVHIIIELYTVPPKKFAQVSAFGMKGFALDAFCGKKRFGSAAYGNRLPDVPETPASLREFLKRKLHIKNCASRNIDLSKSKSQTNKGEVFNLFRTFAAR